MQPTDKMQLCSLDLEYERTQYIKGSGNRLHRAASHLDKEIHTKKAEGLQLVLFSASNNAKNILLSAETGSPKTFTDASIPREVVHLELQALAQDLMKICHASSLFNSTNTAISYKDQIDTIREQAASMLSMAFTKYEDQANLLVLGSRFDQQSSLQYLPREVVDRIIKDAFAVRISGILDSMLAKSALSSSFKISINPHMPTCIVPNTIGQPDDNPADADRPKKGLRAKFKNFLKIT